MIDKPATHQADNTTFDTTVDDVIGFVETARRLVAGLK